MSDIKGRLNYSLVIPLTMEFYIPNVDDQWRFHIEENTCCLNALREAYDRFITNEEPNRCNLCAHASQYVEWPGDEITALREQLAEARRLAKDIHRQLVRVVKADRAGDRITVAEFVLPWEDEK